MENIKNSPMIFSYAKNPQWKETTMAGKQNGLFGTAFTTSEATKDRGWAKICKMG